MVLRGFINLVAPLRDTIMVRIRHSGFVSVFNMESSGSTLPKVAILKLNRAIGYVLLKSKKEILFIFAQTRN